MFLKMSAKHIRVFLLFIWLCILFWQTQPVNLIQEYAGFAFLELGTVRKKNQVNALVKILTDFAVSTLAYFFIGYVIAYGVNFFASAEQLAQAREGSRSKGERLGAQITSLGFLDENELTDFVAKQYGVPSIDLDEFEIEDAVIQLIPEEVALKHTVIPVNRAGSTLILATYDPSNIFALDDIKFLTGYNIQPVVAAEDAIRRAIDTYYDQTTSLEDVMGDFDDSDIDLIHDEEEADVGELAWEIPSCAIIPLNREAVRIADAADALGRINMNSSPP